MKKILKEMATVLAVGYSKIRTRLDKETILLQGYVTHKGLRKIKTANWGDDINKFFFEYASGKEVIMLNGNNLNPDRYICIGSVLGMVNLKNATICGAGVLNPDCKPIGYPREVLMVRGPQTRKWLLENGIPCPEKYGDPALLLPKYYEPKKKEDQKPILIPHCDSWEKVPDKIKAVKSQGYELLDMRNYSNWTDIIDKICNSPYVISESLHGLVIAEAYGIPCVWVELRDHFPRWRFKFEDFYLSIGKEHMDPLKVEENFQKCIIEKIKLWEQATIDFEDIQRGIPFLQKESCE